MRTKIGNQKLPTRFGREVRFVVKSVSAASHHDAARLQFQQLKARLLRPILDKANDPVLRRHLRLATNEASALAWTTPYPLLMLPLLFDEKILEVRRHAIQQRQVQEASQVLIEAVL